MSLRAADAERPPDAPLARRTGAGGEAISSPRYDGECFGRYRALATTLTRDNNARNSYFGKALMNGHEVLTCQWRGMSQKLLSFEILISALETQARGLDTGPHQAR
jgi:hypothetical protein